MIDQSDEKQNTNGNELNNFEAENNPAKDFLYFVFDLIKTSVVVFVIAFSLRYFAVQPFIVDGESMMPNYVNNEYILAEKISYLTGSPKRGDVVVFRYPGNPNISYIKRVIGLPGETVTISNDEVKITNKDKSSETVLKEDYLSDSSTTLVTNSQSGTMQKTLGNDEYFVLGDNREHSSDSRDWGVLPRTNIIGRAWLTILPTNKFGLQKHVDYSRLGSSSFASLVSSNR